MLDVVPKPNYDAVLQSVLQAEDDSACRGALVSPRDREEFDRNCRRLGVAVHNALSIPTGQIMAPDLQNVLSFWITEMREDGTVDRLRRQHFPVLKI